MGTSRPLHLRFGGRSDAVTWAGARPTARASPPTPALCATRRRLSGGAWALHHAHGIDFVRAVDLPSSPRRHPATRHWGRALNLDLHDPGRGNASTGPFPTPDDRLASERAFVVAALDRARACHAALARPPATPCPVPVRALGGDCLLTLARAVAGEGPAGSPPRLEARTRREQDLLYEAGDGRVTRASLLATHLPGAEGAASGSGIAEITQSFFGAADHHGLYADPAFQSLFLRLLLRPGPAPAPHPTRAPLPS
jgi:hypothetical protein